jgi:hypothetical protein
MTDTARISQLVVAAAQALAPKMVTDDALPSITSRSLAIDAIDRVVTQSPFASSKRIWGVLFSMLSAVLALPEIQGMLGAWAPAVTALISAALVAWSKASDTRPEK